MKKISIILISFLFVSESFAQIDIKADKLLKIVSARYKKFKTVKADFIYSIESQKDKLHEKQKGTLFIKGNNFKLDIAGQIIYCDNKTIWTYNKDANEVQVNNYNPKETSIRLDDIFTMYGKGFIYKMVEEKKDGNRELAIIELTPKDKKKNFFKIKLTIDKTNQSIIRSVVYDKSGTTHDYTITNQYPNLKLEDHFFTFDAKKFPKVEIIDLRN